MTALNDTKLLKLDSENYSIKSYIIYLHYY